MKERKVRAKLLIHQFDQFIEITNITSIHPQKWLLAFSSQSASCGSDNIPFAFARQMMNNPGMMQQVFWGSDIFLKPYPCSILCRVHLSASLSFELLLERMEMSRFKKKQNLWASGVGRGHHMCSQAQQMMQDPNMMAQAASTQVAHIRLLPPAAL